jgi:nicotinic acid phosphoribosyltransferase
MIKVTSKTFMVNFETEVKLGNAIELTLVHQAFLYRCKNGNVDIDIDYYIDVKNIKFLGINIEGGYKEFNQFKTQLLELGINLKTLIDEKVNELTNNSSISYNLIEMFRDRLN